MEHSTLSSLIEALERGTKIHICVFFLDNNGNRMTRCTYNQTIHDRPVCLEIKKNTQGLASCYHCRNIVQKSVVRRRKSMAGYCTNGVYEYCRPVVKDDRVICVIFVGNILTDDPVQLEKLRTHVDPQLIDTMEKNFTYQDCLQTADILESYIKFLFDHYGAESGTFDPMIENIKSYIRENMAYDFTMDELASFFNYSPKYLGRVFKLRTGYTIKEYYNQTKVSQAKRLLTETNLSVENVAVQTGFNSAAYFDRVFHKITGLSPQVYRSTAKHKK